MDYQIEAMLQPDMENLRRILKTSGIADLEPELNIRITDLAVNKLVKIHSQNRASQRFKLGVRAPSPLSTHFILNWVQRYCCLYTSTREADIRAGMLAKYRMRIKEQLRAHLNSEKRVKMEMYYTKYQAVVERMLNLHMAVGVNGIPVGECMTREYVTQWFDNTEGIVRFEEMLAKLQDAVEKFAAAFDEYGLSPDDGEEEDCGEEDGYYLSYDSGKSLERLMRFV